MPVSKRPRDHDGQAKAERNIRGIEERGGLFVEAVEATRMPMAVTDPGVINNPIIYANPAFLELCGYERDEVLGQNYFFLAGQTPIPRWNAASVPLCGPRSRSIRRSRSTPKTAARSGPLSSSAQCAMQAGR